MSPSTIDVYNNKSTGGHKRIIKKKKNFKEARTMVLPYKKRIGKQIKVEAHEQWWLRVNCFFTSAGELGDGVTV
jgi:hypothetical protein